MFGRPLLYPPDFVQEVVRVLPDAPEIKNLLDAGCSYSVLLRLEGNDELVQRWNSIFEDQRPKITDWFLMM
jgi:hypothetical protein